MTVTPEERDAMANIMRIMEGQAPVRSGSTTSSTPAEVELAGPGAVTQRDITAMADVLNKLNSVSNSVVKDIISESQYDPEMTMALNTTKTNNGVKVGRYQILVKEDQTRLAGKQYYSVYNSQTNDIIADDLSLYETAIKVVKLLNNGKYTNSQEVRKLFEYDDSYTAHKQDAIRFKRSMNISEKKNDFQKVALYESRYQASIDRAMESKKAIKNFAS